MWCPCPVVVPVLRAWSRTHHVAQWYAFLSIHPSFICRRIVVLFPLICAASAVMLVSSYQYYCYGDYGVCISVSSGASREIQDARALVALKLQLNNFNADCKTYIIAQKHTKHGMLCSNGTHTLLNATSIGKSIRTARSRE